MPFIVKYVDFTVFNLIDENNVFHKEMHISKAKELAKDISLDLVCFSIPSGNQLALCKLIDFGKWKYDEEKRVKKLKKENKKQDKEIRFSPVIDDNDIRHKVKSASDFIEDNFEVSFVMKLKGRQRAFYKEAEVKLNYIIMMCENAKETSRRKTGNSITVRLTKK